MSSAWPLTGAPSIHPRNGTNGDNRLELHPVQWVELFVGIAMDLALIELGASYLLEPKSILGLLWLQTHFEPKSWDLICSGQVRLSADTRVALCTDAAAAGLQISCLLAPAPLMG